MHLNLISSRKWCIFSKPFQWSFSFGCFHNAVIRFVAPYHSFARFPFRQVQHGGFCFCSLVRLTMRTPISRRIFSQTACRVLKGSIAVFAYITYLFGHPVHLQNQDLLIDFVCPFCIFSSHKAGCKNRKIFYSRFLYAEGNTFGEDFSCRLKNTGLSFEKKHKNPSADVNISFCVRQ